ncbi:MAG: PEP-CTERM sorting domain-containing protein, partial [Phycisphaerae bacterium]
MKFLTFILCLTIASCTGVFAQNYAVLMQESPAGAGEIQPGIGVHTFGINQTVTLNTVPKKGYKFVYWLGDVSDPSANRTTMSVDGPKIIIAVFTRDSYELPSANAAICQGPEGLFPRHDELGDMPSIPSPPDEPDDPDDPPPVPEPGTMILLSAGVLALRKRLFKKI